MNALGIVLITGLKPGDARLGGVQLVGKLFLRQPLF
jgi:hypothetical protein